MTNRYRSLFIVCGLALSALLLAFGWLPLPTTSARPTGNTWTVGGPCGTTIQACINYAASGDTVFVPAGTYTEWLWINKPVSLIGSGAETTIVRSSAPRSPALTVYGRTAPPANIDTSTVISGLTFTGGNSTTSGGGIALRMLLTPTIQNVRVIGNQAAAGGGIGVDSGASAVLSNVVITGNVATGSTGYGGGGLIMLGNTIWLNNVLVADNQDGSGHGQIEVLGGTVYLKHGTLTYSGLNPAAGLITRGGTAIINNTIIVNQTTGLQVEAGSLSGDYNLFYGNVTNAVGLALGAHDVLSDPAFVDAARGNYRLLDRSAAIDRGLNAGVTVDFDGDARPVGAGYDIGFDEHRRPAITITTPSALHLISSTTSNVAGLTVPLDQISQVDVSTDNGDSWSTATGTTTFGYTWPVPHEDGVTHVLLARGTDRTRNLGWSDPITVTVDRVPPQAAITQPVLGQVLRGHEYTLTGTTADGFGVNRLEVSVDNGVTYSAVPPLATWLWRWPIPDEDGVSHLLRVRATDVAGNVRADPATLAVFVDNVPPTIRFNNVLTTGVTTILSDTFTVLGTSNGALSTTLTLNSGVDLPVQVVDHTFTQTLSVLITGTYTLRGVAADAAGNSATVTASLVVTPYAPLPHLIRLPVIMRNFDPQRDRYESDDTATNAQLIMTNGVSQRHNFYPLNDVDWVWFDAVPGTYIINATGTAADTDTLLRLYASNGVTKLAENDDCSPTTRASCLTWQVTTGGTLYLQIAPYDQTSSGATRWYDVTVVKQ